MLICGGIGPTQDDLTRDAVAELMGVPLVRRMELAEHIATMFRTRLRDMPQNNLRQADVPEGGEPLPNPIGTAPGLCCPVGDGKVVYAVPGVPYEMQEMVHDAGDPRPACAARARSSAIVSRSLKTWGTSESALAEMVAHRLDALDASGDATIAFLARGIEGLVVRITAKGETEADRAGDGRRRGARSCARFSATSCSASTTRRWSTRCSAQLRDTRLDARRRGVGHGRADRRSDRERARRERDVPRHDRRRTRPT